MAKDLIFEYANAANVDQYPSCVRVHREVDGEITFSVRSPQKPPEAHLNLPAAVKNLAGNSGCVILSQLAIKHLIVALNDKGILL